MNENLKTPSALSDEFKKFLNQFKDKDGSFKYVDIISSHIKTKQVIEINPNDFTKEIKDSFKNLTEHEKRNTIYRAVKEIFSNDEGVSRTASAIREDRIQIKFNDKVFGNEGKKIKDDIEVKPKKESKKQEVKDTRQDSKKLFDFAKKTFRKNCYLYIRYK